MQSFCGEVSVQPDNFEATFERLILSEEAISFRLQAIEPKPTEPNWFVDDRAVRIGNLYVASSARMIFDDDADPHPAILTISAQPTDKGCYVRVRFEQIGEDVWELAGELWPFASTE
jgi:hypothetical protein